MSVGFNGRAFLSAVDQHISTKIVIDTNLPPWIDNEVRKTKKGHGSEDLSS